MRKIMQVALAAAIALAPAAMMAGCEGWETVTNGGIAIDSAERDANGYIVEEAARAGALRMADETLTEAECTMIESRLDDSESPARWVVDFDAYGTSYHYVVDAESGELIDFQSLTL